MDQDDERRLRNGTRVWWLNVVAGIVLTVGIGAASVFQFSLASGAITQRAPLDPDETAGQAFMMALVALVFAAVTTWLLVKTVKLSPRQRAERGASWLYGRHIGSDSQDSPT